MSEIAPMISIIKNEFDFVRVFMTKIISIYLSAYASQYPSSKYIGVFRETITRNG